MIFLWYPRGNRSRCLGSAFGTWACCHLCSGTNPEQFGKIHTIATFGVVLYSVFYELPLIIQRPYQRSLAAVAASWLSLASLFLPFPLAMVGWKRREYRDTDEHRVEGMIVLIRRRHTGMLTQSCFCFLKFVEVGRNCDPEQSLNQVNSVLIDKFESHPSKPSIIPIRSSSESSHSGLLLKNKLPSVACSVFHTWLFCSMP